MAVRPVEKALAGVPKSSFRAGCIQLTQLERYLSFIDPLLETFESFLFYFSLFQGSGSSLSSPVTELANLIILSPSSPSSNHNGSSSLTFLPFRPEHFRPDVHSSFYKCLASNAYGMISSTPIRIRAGPFVDYLAHYWLH